MSQEHFEKYFPPAKKRLLYPFYRVKDGDDCLKKTLTLSAYSGGAGAFFAFVNGFISTTIADPALGSSILIKMGRYAPPMLAAGGVFAATVCTSSSLRGGKDSPLNHFIGGLAAGSVFGAAFKSHKLGWGLGLAFGTFAAFNKAGQMEGFTRINFHKNQCETGFKTHSMSFLTSRPDPEGDPNV